VESSRGTTGQPSKTIGQEAVDHVKHRPFVVWGQRASLWIGEKQAPALHRLCAELMIGGVHVTL